VSARRTAVGAVVVLLALSAAACSSSSHDAMTRSLDPLEPPTTVTPTTAAPTGTPAACDPTASLRPPYDGVPTPSQFAPGSTMAEIRTRKLIVGVDEGTTNWGYRNPTNGQLEGLDVDLLKQIANAIFGDGQPMSHVQFITLTTAERIDAVADRKVDMVASLLSATCARWQRVNFSTEYFEAHQNVLVPIDSKIQTVEDLAGKTVCATRGSTSIEQIHERVPTAVLHPVAARADCLVALQEGEVDAVTSDDTVLASFEAQEKLPRTRTLDPSPPLSNEHYAIAIAKDRPDLVEFVNAVLQQMRDDGRLEDLYRYWLGRWLGNNIPAPPAPAYLP
jgi:polar amino acid transport system substrate-binding protein